MKKTIALLISVALTIMLIISCAPKAEATTAPATAATGTPAAQSAPAPATAPAAVAAPATSTIAKPSSPKKFSMASGSVGGNFYLVGGGIAQEVNKVLPEYFMMTSETTGGGAANLGLLQAGDAELGIAMTSSLSEGMAGEVKWTAGVKHEKLRVVLALYPSWLTIYTLADSGIKSMSDLKGKIVGLGTKGMAMDSIFRKFFEDQGIQVKQFHNDGHQATATALGDKVIDAAILFSYPPFAAISSLESTTKLSFIPLTPAEQDYLVGLYPFYSKDAMPAGSYKGTTVDVPGVSEWNMLVSSNEVSADDVYLMVKAFVENQKDLLAIYGGLKYMTAENTLNSNIYLHAGTIRYMKELGLTVPASMIPPEYKN